MKILAISDLVVERLYTAPIAELFSEVDLILACGDLPYEYLEYLVTMSHVPVLYVPGNHDPQYDLKNAAARAEGCDHLDLKVQRVKGLNLAGLGGSIRYKPASPNQACWRG
ncbi:MAG: metallophosphoesterase family protein [Chloroflexota bacterium]